MSLTLTVAVAVAAVLALAFVLFVRGAGRQNNHYDKTLGGDVSPSRTFKRGKNAGYEKYRRYRV